MEQNKREQFIIRRIGGTTYKVKVVFNESGYETMEDKILRIVRNDMVTNDGTCPEHQGARDHHSCHTPTEGGRAVRNRIGASQKEGL